MRRTIIVSCSFLAFLGAAEAVARLAFEPPGYHAGMDLVVHPRLGFAPTGGWSLYMRDELAPCSYDRNASGFRGAELPPVGSRKPAGVERILFVGDSFVDAWGVCDDRWLPYLTREALGRAGRAVEVHALAVSDYGTAQELMLLQDFGERIRPDAVVLVMYPHNDLINNTIELAGTSSVSAGDYLRPYLVPEPDGTLRVRYVQPGRAFLRRHSRLFALFEKRWVVRERARAPSWPFAAETPAMVRRGERRPPAAHFDVFREVESGGPWEVAWATTEALLTAFRAEVERLGARLVVVVVPAVWQVQRNALCLAMDAFMEQGGGPRLGDVVDWNLPERRLAELFRRLDIVYRLLLEPLRSAALDDDWLYLSNGHLTGRAQELAAAEIAAWYGEPDRPAPPAFTDVRRDGPTSSLPDPANALGWLDFRAADHRAYLAGGWDEWRSELEGGSGLWMTSTFAELVLPAREGSVVVRGIVPPYIPLPLAGHVTVAAARRTSFELTEPGPFELRVDPDPPDELREHPWATVQVAVERTHRLGADLREFGLFVQQVGFESSALAGSAR